MSHDRGCAVTTLDSSPTRSRSSVRALSGQDLREAGALDAEKRAGRGEDVLSRNRKSKSELPPVRFVKGGGAPRSPVLGSPPTHALVSRNVRVRAGPLNGRVETTAVVPEYELEEEDVTDRRAAIKATSRRMSLAGGTEGVV